MTAQQSEDMYLLTRLKCGDEFALEQLFLKYQPSLMRFATQLLPHPSTEREDILLEVFYKIWEQRERIELHTSLSAYLYRSVRNRINDHYRKQKKLILVDESEGLDTCSTDQLPDQLLMYQELHYTIDQLIHMLPERMQLIFRMNREDELTYEEIAELLGISINSVKTQMYRALKFLKDAFQEHRSSH